MPHISPSQLEAFNCRLSWYWGTKKHYKPLRLNPTLELGLGVHYALERFYKDRKHPVKIFTRWADKRISEIEPQFDDDVEGMVQARTLGISMLEGYLEQYYKKEPLKVITTEHECTRTVPGTDCNIMVRVDAIVEDTDLEELFVLEHKTFSRFTLGQLERDHQFVAEAWVGNKLCKELTGRNLTGVIYNGLRKAVPSKRTKLGMFERHHIYVNQHQVRVFLTRTQDTWATMSKYPDLKIYPQPQQVRCGYCHFKEPCTEYMKGGDYKFILANLFKQEEYQHLEVAAYED